MVWIVAVAITLSLFAGVGLKCLVDRIWPPDYGGQLAKTLEHIVEQVQPTRARHAYQSDHTLDVLADGMAAGQRNARSERADRWAPDPGDPDPYRPRESWISQLGGGQPGVYQGGGGWINGPSLDPVEQPGNGLLS